VHNCSHGFCRGDQGSTLDILLDREKLYPLLCRPQAEGGSVSPDGDAPEIRVMCSVSIKMGLKRCSWFSII
jgi:hypothetical protein